MDPTTTTTSDDGDLSHSSLWRRVLRPPVLLAVGSPVVLVISLVLLAVFLLRENWHGVLLSAVAFVTWTQLIYWFFRARTLLHPRHPHQVCARDTESGVADDAPPPYEEVIKTEAPPPPYYMVVCEGGWSGGETLAAKGEPASKKNLSSGLGGQRDATTVGMCGGITAPYLHHITSDEHGPASVTTRVLPDPAQVIRAPLDREFCRLAVPVHKASPVGPITAADTAQEAAGCQDLFS